MSLRKSQGNMYEFCSHTFNIIKGQCPHFCDYCYMKVFPQGKLRFDKQALKTDLGKNNFIFVGSSCDIFAEKIPENWIKEVLAYCLRYSENRYLFQSKNPKRMYALRQYIPQLTSFGTTVLGTTIETNRRYKEMGEAPEIAERIAFLYHLKNYGFETFLTIEPIMDFDLEELVRLIKLAQPSWVNIGADSKNHHLIEPSKEKIEMLIEELKKFTEIKIKHNLERIKGKQ